MLLFSILPVPAVAELLRRRRRQRRRQERADDPVAEARHRREEVADAGELVVADPAEAAADVALQLHRHDAVLVALEQVHRERRLLQLRRLELRPPAEHHRHVPRAMRRFFSSRALGKEPEPEMTVEVGSQVWFIHQCSSHGA
uniref:Uncharacterized protein n=1 Tax=Oryza meridionalis TaxID=40149 RepID=A0A0E0F023_9ORYZ